MLRKHHQTYYAYDESQRKQYFYEVRHAYNAQRSQIDFDRFADQWIVRAAYMIFLNKTCYNGLYRVNSSGGFNVPFGRYKRPSILDEPNLLAVSALLQNAKLLSGRFQDCEQFIDDHTFVYFDPPYRPISATSSFTSYSKDKFDDDDQIELAQFFARLDSRYQAKLMLSNSDPANVDPADGFFQSIYGNFRIHTVWANRMINSQAQKTRENYRIVDHQLLCIASDHQITNTVIV